MNKFINFLKILLFESVMILVSNFILLNCFNFVLFPIFNWFYTLSLGLKFLIIFIGLGATYSIIKVLIGILGALVFVPTKRILKIQVTQNLINFGYLIIVANVVMELKVLWDSFIKFNFWDFVIIIPFCLGIIITINKLLDINLLNYYEREKTLNCKNSQTESGKPTKQTDLFGEVEEISPPEYSSPILEEILKEEIKLRQISLDRKVKLRRE